MSNKERKNGNSLSIVITVVSGKLALRRCLSALSPQARAFDAEIIVPYDKWSLDVGELKNEFPEVNFHLITNLGKAAKDDVSSHQHRLYDRRRAVGLNLSRGHLVAMTEDHAVPAPDWVKQILAVHKQPFEVIGGAIDNAVDHPLNWALYYCDFGRYGNPLPESEADYVSDVNVTYKRAALESVRNLWAEAYQETIVHWALKNQGVSLRLDPRLTVYQHRPEIGFRRAFRERIEWGRVFAETRVAMASIWQRVFLAFMTPLLPPLLLRRLFKHARRQKRTAKQMAVILPVAAALLIGWACGEFAGYVRGAPDHEGQPQIADHDLANSQVSSSE